MCVRACVYVHVCYCILSWPDSHLDVVMRTLRVTQVKSHNRPEASAMYVHTVAPQTSHSRPTHNQGAVFTCVGWSVSAHRPSFVPTSFVQLLCAIATWYFFISLLTTYIRMFCTRRLLLCFFFWKHYSKRSIAGNAVVAEVHVTSYSTVLLHCLRTPTYDYGCPQT